MNVPNRPGIVIREPERERKKGEKPVNMDSAIGSAIDKNLVENMKAPKQDVIIIYTNVSKCKFSPDILDLAIQRKIPFQQQDVDATTAPAWLPGTPSVVHGDSVYCGDAAFKFVETLTCKKETEKPSNKGKIKDKALGCDFASAFSAPQEVDDNDQKYQVSTDEMMQRILRGRK